MISELFGLYEVPRKADFCKCPILTLTQILSSHFGCSVHVQSTADNGDDFHSLHWTQLVLFWFETMIVFLFWRVFFNLAYSTLSSPGHAISIMMHSLSRHKFLFSLHYITITLDQDIPHKFVFSFSMTSSGVCPYNFSVLANPYLRHSCNIVVSPFVICLCQLCTFTDIISELSLLCHCTSCTYHCQMYDPF